LDQRNPFSAAVVPIAAIALGGIVFFALLMPETKPQESLGFEPPQGDISTSKPA
jgi:hypothetical protein